VSIGRVIVALLAGGLAFMAAGIVLYGQPAHAASPREREVPEFQYTSHAATVAASTRTIPLYVDSDFDQGERQHIVAAFRQWNYVLNGFIRFDGRLLPGDASKTEVESIRRNGGWVVARVDSSHPVAQKGVGIHALAVTVSGGRNGGFVYVIADRLGGRDLTGVVMHEFGHVLGAGHDNSGLMAPVYNPVASRCIDYAAVAMVAQAQHLSMRDLNWCETPRSNQPFQNQYQPRAALSQVR